MASDQPEHDRVFLEGFKPSDVALLRDVAEFAAEKAVNSAFTRMGLDPSEPIKAQRDFNFLRDLTHDGGLKADMIWLRRRREQSEGIWGKLVYTIVGASVFGALNAMYVGLKALIVKFH